ncbi:ferredoxin--NAD(+) reductase [Methylobacterium sp. A54F]
MSARCSLVVNGKSVRVSTGDTPLEAAVAEGMIAPALGVPGAELLGQAPAVRRSPPRGRRLDGVRIAPAQAATFHPLPEPRATPLVRRVGTVTQVTPLGPRAIEVVVTVTKAFAFEPGHQVELLCSGEAPVTLSPTLRVDGAAELNELVLHLPASLAAASALGRLGCDVKVKGPLGRAQYRPGGGRLVLVASETGFAPVWAIARAARYIEPAREVAVFAGARDPLDLYMRPALDWLRATGVARVVLAADRARQRPPDVRPGPLTAHLPPLRATDVVHVAGCASTVGAVQVLAAAVGARCYPILLPDA